MLWEHEPQASVSTAFFLFSLFPQLFFPLLAPSLPRQQRTLVLCLHSVIQHDFQPISTRAFLGLFSKWGYRESYPVLLLQHSIVKVYCGTTRLKPMVPLPLRQCCDAIYHQRIKADGNLLNRAQSNFNRLKLDWFFEVFIGFVNRTESNSLKRLTSQLLKFCWVRLSNVTV